MLRPEHLYSKRYARDATGLVAAEEWGPFGDDRLGHETPREAQMAEREYPPHNTVDREPPPAYLDLPPPGYGADAYVALPLGGAARKAAVWPRWQAIAIAATAALDLLTCTVLTVGMAIARLHAAPTGRAPHAIGFAVLGLYMTLAVLAALALERRAFGQPLWRLVVGVFCGMLVVRLALDTVMLVSWSAGQYPLWQQGGPAWQERLAVPVLGVRAIQDLLFPCSGAPAHALAPAGRVLWDPLGDSQPDAFLPYGTLVSSDLLDWPAEAVTAAASACVPPGPEGEAILAVLRRERLLMLGIHAAHAAVSCFSFVRSPFMRPPKR